MTDETPMEGDEYTHSDGTTEIVYLTEDGRVLTLREYPSASAFNETVDAAAYRGINDDVAALPDRDAFLDAEFSEDADEPNENSRTDETGN